MSSRHNRRVPSTPPGAAVAPNPVRERFDKLLRGERPNWRALPEPLDSAHAPYANKRPELKRRLRGEMLCWLLSTQAWQEVMGPVLDQVEITWQASRRNQQTRWNSHQLEAVFIYRHLSGRQSLRQARLELTGEHGLPARETIFADPGARTGGRPAKLDDSVPSAPSLTRHRRRLPDERREELYRQVFERIVVEHLHEFPEFREECRIVDMDGALMPTAFTTPHLEKLPAGFIGPPRCYNTRKVTCWDGGYIPEADKTTDHRGSGFNHVALVSQNALPLALDVVPFHHSEKDSGVRLVQQFSEHVRAHLDPDKICVLTADGGFNTPRLRVACRAAGIVENCHPQSHRITQRAADSIETLTNKRWVLHGYPNWHANELRELHCSCGDGKSYRKLSVRNGRAVVRVEGRCATCGPCNITSGEWRRTKNPDGFRRKDSGDPPETVDWLMGNPLTYNDMASRIYGRDRFGHNEGYNSALSTRFTLAPDAPRRIASLRQARIESYGTAIAMHAIAMGYRRIIATQNTAPPPTPLSARRRTPPPATLPAAA